MKKWVGFLEERYGKDKGPRKSTIIIVSISSS